MYWEKRWFQFAILLLLAFIWGSSFILMKIGLKSFTSNQAAGIRMLLASLVLMPYSIKNLKYLKKKDVKSLLVAGFFGSFIPAFLFTKAQTRIDSSLAGMLNSLTPVFTLVVGILFYRAKSGWRQIFGLFLGILGASGLILSTNGYRIEEVNSYAFFVVIASSCYAFNINEVKARLSHLSGTQITSLSFFLLGPTALIYLSTSDFSPVMENENWLLHFSCLAALGVVGTAAAMLLMNSLIRRTTALMASSVTYVIPVFAIVWGFVDGENITVFQLLFMVLILFGVYLINKRK